MDRVADKPVTERAVSYDQLRSIVEHPAFRLGFLDAQQGRDFDHDRILDRILVETPPTALARIGWPVDDHDGLFGKADRAARVALAQYRYEDGRLAVMEKGLRCRAWGHPDFPPKQVDDYCWNRHEKMKGEAV